MTLATIIETLKMIALKHPNVNSAYEGNIYDILNSNPNNKYASVVITQQSHTTDEVYDHYGFVIFYVDRLVDDMEENRVQIQSCGKSMLGNIITFFCEEFEAECDNITYQPFTQKFVDMTCGVYCTITIDTVKDVYCPEEYWKEDWVTPVTVIRNQDKRVTFTENGTYTIDYDPTTYTGLGNVEVNVNIDVNSYYNNGYNQGKTDGVNEQKSKLETINITENGTYTKQDGYNHIEVNVPDLNGSYDEGYQQGHTEGYNEGYTKGEGIGYSQGQADVAANARVLEVTENGNYLSKFSDPITPTLITGVYADGTDFYNYAQLGNKVYNTNITVTQDSVIELWYKGDNAKTNDGWNTIFGCAKRDDKDFYLGYMYSDNTNLRGFLGQKEIQFSWDDNVWHHIIMKNDGLWIDDALIGSFNTTKTFAYNLDLNGTWDSYIRNANGCYGMIKIDNTIIIPTANGFLNTNTGELLEVVKDGDYTFTENLPIYGEGELYKTVNVNVLPKINVEKAGLSFAYSAFKEVPEWVDFEGITDMYHMFQNCSNLQTIPQLDVSNVTNADYMLSNCTNLKTLPNNFNFGICTNMDSFFSNTPITDYSFLETWVINPNANMNNMIDNTNITYVPAIPCVGNASYFQSAIFWAYGDFSKLTYFGGWIGRKYNVTQNYILKKMTALSYESCISILNNLYDFTGNGETPDSSQGQLKVAQSFIDTVGEEISIGTLKGWVISV